MNEMEVNRREVARLWKKYRKPHPVPYREYLKDCNKLSNMKTFFIVENDFFNALLEQRNPTTSPKMRNVKWL